MTHPFMNKLLTALILICSIFPTQAQEDLTKYFPAGQADAGILINEFIVPFTEAIGAGVNNGWYTTASVHKPLGFDLSVTANIVFIPSDQEFYDFPSGQVNVEPVDGNTSIPTVYGPENDIRDFRILGGANDQAIFDGPDGIEIGENVPLFNAAVIPTIQLGIGTVKKTDLRLRFSPKITIDQVKYGSIGVGLMHDIKQHIPGIRLAPIDLSIFIGYTKLDGEIDLSAQFPGTGQVGNIDVGGFTVQVLVGKTLPWVSFYGGLGYNTYNLDLDVEGSYTVGMPDANSESTVILPAPFPLNDPFNFNYDGNGIRATVGARLKLGPVTINGDYTLHGVSNVLTLGFGFTFETKKI